MTETRSDGTARVTAAVVSWVWRQGRCALALEVGLHGSLGLCTPWESQWRVDVAAVVEKNGREITHVIEVKGSTADTTRENMAKGKWVVSYEDMGLTPWLAVARTVSPSAYEDLPGSWGILIVDDKRVRRIRSPNKIVKSYGGDGASYRSIARVLTNQALPTMSGLSNAQARRELVRAGVHRPWRHWHQEIDLVKKVVRSEDGNIL